MTKNGQVSLWTGAFMDAAYSAIQTHTHTHKLHARHQPAHWEQLGVKYPAQGHFDMISGGGWDRTSNPPITGQPPSPEPVPPSITSAVDAARICCGQESKQAA